MSLPEALPRANELRESQHTIEEVAISFLDDPLMRQWLDGFYETVGLSQNYDGKPLPANFFDRDRGGETVRFGTNVYAGVTEDGRYFDVRVDESGYHRMVVIGDDEANWKEPLVYDGSSRTDFSGQMRVDFMNRHNPAPWQAHFNPNLHPEVPVEGRDSIVVQLKPDGALTAYIHDGLTHQDIKCFPLKEVMGLIHDFETRPDADVIDLAARRRRAGEEALHHSL